MSFELTTRISQKAECYIIANRKGKKFLPFFMIIAFLNALYLIKKNKVDLIHLSDALLSPLGLILKKLTGIKITSTVHALDVTYNNKYYQYIISYCLKKTDRIIAVSNYTLHECLKRGVLPFKCVFIPNGVDTQKFYLNVSDCRDQLQKLINVDLNNKKILLSVGHLIRRKGFEWFIENIMPKLDSNYIYLIIGSYGNASIGNEIKIFHDLISRLHLQNQIFLLGNVQDKILKLAYNSADFLIMPNIKVKGDAEGFGIVAIEAGSCGVPVITSGIEGINDAVINGKTGWCVGEKNNQGFLDKIDSGYIEKKKIMESVNTNFNWNKIVEKYLNEFNSVVSSSVE